ARVAPADLAQQRRPFHRAPHPVVPDATPPYPPHSIARPPHPLEHPALYEYSGGCRAIQIDSGGVVVFRKEKHSENVQERHGNQERSYEGERREASHRSRGLALGILAIAAGVPYLSHADTSSAPPVS